MHRNVPCSAKFSKKACFVQVLDERIARDGIVASPRVLYTVPVGHNPTGVNPYVQ